MKLTGVGEASIIGLFRHASETAARGLLQGIGDDAAVFSSSADARCLVSTDLLIENIHFSLRTITPYQLGYKSVAVNVSDIRSMNGRPTYLLLSLALPTELEFKEIETFAAGVREAEERFDVSVIGGDTCRSSSGLFIAVTVIGEAAEPVYRSGAKAGDRLYVTGTVGDSAAGLELLNRLNSRVDLEHPGEERLAERLGIRCRNEDIQDLIERHLMPVPVMKELGPGISAMIDLSDGLLTDLDRLCAASGTGVRLFVDAVPRSEALQNVCSQLGLNSVDLSLGGGEDYELLYTASAGARVEGATCIGEIISGGREMIRENRSVPWPESTGYDHFGSPGKA